MVNHFIPKNATAHKVNSYCIVAISYCTFCVEKHTILGPVLNLFKAQIAANASFSTVAQAL